MRALILFVAAVMALLAGAADARASEAGKAELVMVEQHGCHWCERWNAEIGPILPKTEEGRRAPLRRVDLRDLPGDIAFASPPVFTPTFVLVRDGTELGRIEGYAGDEFFWFLLNRLLDEHIPAGKG